MDLQVSTEKFKKAVSCAARAVSTKAIQPILGNVLIRGKGNLLLVSATDLDLHIECKLKAKIEEQGEVTLPAKKVEEIAVKTEGENINIKIDKNQLAKIVAGKAKFQLNGMSAEEYPEIISKKTEDVYQIKQEELQRALSMTNFAVSKFETSSILSGANFAINGKEFEIGATDGSRLARYTGKLETKGKIDKAAFVIPLRALLEIERLCSSFKEDNEFVYFYSLPGQIIFYNNDFQISTRLMNGNFPEYDKLIPKNNPNKARVSTGLLLDSLDRVSILCNERTNVVKMSFSSGRNILKIDAQSQDYGSATDEIDIEYKGDDLDITFNYKYMVEALRSIKEEQIELNMDSSLAPIIIRISKEVDFDYTYLIMPVQAR